MPLVFPAIQRQQQDQVLIQAHNNNTQEQDMVGMSWDNVIDKEVKSADKQDLGKVESIAKHYVEVKQGTISKKHYFIPKYYIQGYDGHKLWVSLTKDEIKRKYERDNPPLESEIETSEYLEHKQKMDTQYPQFLHGIPWMAKEPGVSLQTPVTHEPARHSMGRSDTQACYDK